jgi:hypothetical protein
MTQSAAGAGEFELGETLGRRRAFGAMAGRCSAADAACIKRIRDEKLFKHRCASWLEFCQKYLGMSSRSADRTIRLLEEHGPDYFELAQLTQISPHEFRAIAPAVKDGAVHLNGEAIALIPQNSDKVADAVAALRQAAKTPAPSESKPAIDALPSLESRGLKLAQDFDALLGAGPSVEHSSRIEAALKRLHSALYRAEINHGLV